jgi:hypothetical protein
LTTILAIEAMRGYRPETRFLYACEPIFSFHADIPIPPRLGILPLKRFWAGEASMAMVAAEIESSRPELILLANDANEPPFFSFLNQEYQPVFEDKNTRLYRLRR